MTEERANSLTDKINSQGVSVLTKLFFPRQMKYQIRQIDLMNRDSLYYLERLDAFDIMQTHIMDRIMQEYWQSNLDANGNFMGASTAFRILTHYEDRYRFDYEFQNRFYKKQKTKLIQPHRMTFMVVRRSMQVRYFLEMLFFFTLACTFQYYIFSFSYYYNEVNIFLTKLEKHGITLGETTPREIVETLSLEDRQEIRDFNTWLTENWTEFVSSLLSAA